ncbi:MAG: hypothetical protein HKO62_03640 [Gammaproteobacteria bacterium]|nr:hypothetical protein [Gammaproteobacteria bacterium]
MPTFAELLNADADDLVRHCYQLSSWPGADFEVKVTHVAQQLALTHAQLTCAQGFNPRIVELPDIQEAAGFSSPRLLELHRAEVYTRDAYDGLNIDDVLELCTAVARNPDLTLVMQSLLPARLASIEAGIGRTDNPAYTVSYRIEVTALYASGIANPAFFAARLRDETAAYRLVTEEIIAAVESGLAPASNLFFGDELLGEEKLLLIEHKLIPGDMVRNRLANHDIDDEERAALEQALSVAANTGGDGTGPA